MKTLLDDMTCRPTGLCHPMFPPSSLHLANMTSREITPPQQSTPISHEYVLELKLCVTFSCPLSTYDAARERAKLRLHDSLFAPLLHNLFLALDAIDAGMYGEAQAKINEVVCYMRGVKDVRD